MLPVRLIPLCLVPLLAIAACDTTINEDVVIPAGAREGDGARTINGDILVGAKAEGGNLKTVNGRIVIDEGAKVDDLATVNGDIRIGTGASTGSIEGVNSPTACAEGVRIRGGIRLVNGSVDLQPGTTVEGSVRTVNGHIGLRSATVRGSVENYEGGMTLSNGSVVTGNLVVLRPVGSGSRETPRVIIGRDSRVEGMLRFEREVRLYVHETATVGTIEGAEAIAYDEEPPQDG